MGSACTKGVKSTATVSPAPEPARDPPVRSLKRLDTPGPGYRSKRRGSVSAEPSGGRASLPPTRQSIAKLAHSTLKIQELVRSTLLFKELDEEQEACIIDAMFERRVAAGEVVIREGEEADNFYVIESGTFAASKAGADGGPPEWVTTYEGKGAFGELALMYNCPRAATVTALTEGVLWGVDRATFRSLVVASMEERRQRYEGALRAMPILHHLTPGQLAAVADCLHQETFEPGEYILWEGAPLDESAKFYMLESGGVDCFRTFEGKKRAVKSLRAGDVFGEVALLTKAPRQADCVAASQCKCLTMSRDAFERLMGPAEEVLSQQIAQYAQANEEQEAASASHHHAAAAATEEPPGEEEAVAEGPPAAAAAATAGDGIETNLAAAGTKGKPGAEAAEASPAAEAAQAAVGVSAQDAAAVPEPAAEAAAAEPEKPPASRTPEPAPAPGSPSHSGAAALLPGSPRPPLRLSDNSFSRRRSGRSAGARSAASSSDGEAASAGGSPTALSPLAPAQQPGGDGCGAGKPASPAVGDAGAGQESGEESPAMTVLPPIAEEPVEGGGLSRTTSKGRPRGSSAASAASSAGKAAPPKKAAPAAPAGKAKKGGPAAGPRTGGK